MTPRASEELPVLISYKLVQLAQGEGFEDGLQVSYIDHTVVCFSLCLTLLQIGTFSVV